MMKYVPWLFALLVISLSNSQAQLLEVPGPPPPPATMPPSSSPDAGVPDAGATTTHEELHDKLNDIHEAVDHLDELLEHIKHLAD
jgi:hypothetical protein